MLHSNPSGVVYDLSQLPTGLPFTVNTEAGLRAVLAGCAAFTWPIYIKVTITADLLLSTALFDVNGACPRVRLVGDAVACAASRAPSDAWQGAGQCALTMSSTISSTGGVRHFNVLNGAILELDSLALLGGNTTTNVAGSGRR